MLPRALACQSRRSIRPTEPRCRDFRRGAAASHGKLGAPWCNSARHVGPGSAARQRRQPGRKQKPGRKPLAARSALAASGGCRRRLSLLRWIHLHPPHRPCLTRRLTSGEGHRSPPRLRTHATRMRVKSLQHHDASMAMLPCTCEFKGCTPMHHEIQQFVFFTRGALSCCAGTATAIWMAR